MYLDILINEVRSVLSIVGFGAGKFLFRKKDALSIDQRCWHSGVPHHHQDPVLFVIHTGIRTNLCPLKFFEKNVLLGQVDARIGLVRLF